MQSDSKRQRVEWWLPGAGGREKGELLFSEFKRKSNFERGESSRDLLCSHAQRVNATIL